MTYTGFRGSRRSWSPLTLSLAALLCPRGLLAQEESTSAGSTELEWSRVEELVVRRREEVPNTPQKEGWVFWDEYGLDVGFVSDLDGDGFDDLLVLSGEQNGDGRSEMELLGSASLWSSLGVIEAPGQLSRISDWSIVGRGHAEPEGVRVRLSGRAGNSSEEMIAFLTELTLSRSEDGLEASGRVLEARTERGRVSPHRAWQQSLDSREPSFLIPQWGVSAKDPSCERIELSNPPRSSTVEFSGKAAGGEKSAKQAESGPIGRGPLCALRIPIEWPGSGRWLLSFGLGGLVESTLPEAEVLRQIQLPDALAVTSLLAIQGSVESEFGVIATQVPEDSERPERGSVSRLSWPSLKVVWQSRVPGDIGIQFGTRAVLVGDLDGDDVLEVAVAAEGGGELFVFSGRGGQLLQRVSSGLGNFSAREIFGACLAVPRVAAPGTRLVAVGTSTNRESFGSKPGRVLIFDLARSAGARRIAVLFRSREEDQR